MVISAGMLRSVEAKDHRAAQRMCHPTRAQYARRHPERTHEGSCSLVRSAGSIASTLRMTLVRHLMWLNSNQHHRRVFEERLERAKKLRRGCAVDGSVIAGDGEVHGRAHDDLLAAHDRALGG